MGINRHYALYVGERLAQCFLTAAKARRTAEERFDGHWCRVIDIDTQKLVWEAKGGLNGNQANVSWMAGRTGWGTL